MRSGVSASRGKNCRPLVSRRRCANCRDKTIFIIRHRQLIQKHYQSVFLSLFSIIPLFCACVGNLNLANRMPDSCVQRSIFDRPFIVTVFVFINRFLCLPCKYVDSVCLSHVSLPYYHHMPSHRPAIPAAIVPKRERCCRINIHVSS